MSDFSCSFEQSILFCMYVIQCFTCTGTGIFTGRTNAPIASFVCGAGVVVELDELCDGVDDCGGGDDEETALCESEFHCASLFIIKNCVRCRQVLVSILRVLFLFKRMYLY